MSHYAPKSNLHSGDAVDVVSSGLRKLHAVQEQLAKELCVGYSDLRLHGRLPVRNEFIYAMCFKYVWLCF